jgi:arginine deiminase
VLPPLPNTLFCATRVAGCTAVSIVVYWPARNRAYNVAAIYKAHPMFAGAGFDFWYPPEGPDGRFRQPTSVCPRWRAAMSCRSNGAVLIGMSERSQGG